MSLQATTIYAFSVPTMKCEQYCAAPIRQMLSKLTGVIACEVSFEGKYARVQVVDGRINQNTILAKIKEMGFEASYLGVIEQESSRQNQYTSRK